MSVPRHVTVKHVSPEHPIYTLPKRFEVHGDGLCWGVKVFTSIPALARWLDKHDYRYSPGTNGEWYRP